MRTDKHTQTEGRTDGQRDRRDETQSHFSQFCERAQKLEVLEHMRIGQPVEPNHHYINPVHMPATHS